MMTSNQRYPMSVFLAALGFFMYLLLPEATLNMLGLPYGQEGSPLWLKVHPGTFFIMAGFLTEVTVGGNPLNRIFLLMRDQSTSLILLLIYILIILYWAARGPKGLGLLLDQHITLPLCLIVFSYASTQSCHLIARLFVALAFINSGIGIAESLTHTHVLPYDANWSVLRENYFRATALLGHPLSNATFTACALFCMWPLRLSLPVRTVILTTLLMSLVAFGGRSSLALCLLGLSILGVFETRRFLKTKQLTLLRLIVVTTGTLLIPLLCISLLYALLHSGMGERLMAYSTLEDNSAHVRLQSWRVFEFLTPSDFLLGIDSDQVDQIANRLGLVSPESDIENPWILMFLFLGGIAFTLWLLSLLAVMVQLCMGAPLALQLAVVEYFAIASTSNSFGRKDPLFMVIPALVLCIKKLSEAEKSAAHQSKTEIT